ncbi:MAG: hypothetical protein ACP5G1_04690, partial [Nanopusillaceae archaeon]
ALQVLLYLTGNSDRVNQLLRVINDLQIIGNRISYDRNLENKFKNNLYKLCNIISTTINSIQSTISSPFLQNLNKALNVLRQNIWINACLNNTINQQINDYINCIKYTTLRNIVSGENILDFVQNITGIPTNVIQHKPVKYVRLEFVDSAGKVIKDESIETIDLIYSLMPFTLYSLSPGKYFVFVPSEDNITEGRELSGSNIIVPLKIRLHEVSKNNITYTREERGRSSKIFEININAISSTPSFYACKLGYIPVMMSDKCENYGCPRRDQCYDSKSNKYKYVVKIDDSYLRTYHINAETEKVINFYDPQTIAILLGNYSGGIKPILRINLEEASAILRLKRVIFTPRERHQWKFFMTPKLPIKIRGHDLGLDLYETKAFVLRFNKEFLKEVIRNIINNNSKVRNYLCLKYHASGQEEYIYDKIVDAVKDFVRSPSSICDPMKLVRDNDFINYALEVFAHTLAHVLLTLIAAKLQIEPYKTLDYYYKINEEDVLV